MPCEIISVDVQDILGTHIVDFEGTLVKNIIDEKGNIIETIQLHEQKYKPYDLVNKVKDSLGKKLGCNLKGSIIVNKVSGNFHVSSHAFQEALMILYANGNMIDISHDIKHLSFGEEESISMITKLTGGYNVSPLDKKFEHTKPKMLHSRAHNTHTTYYMHITPTKYLVGDDEEYAAHEYTYSTQTLTTHGMPAVFFKYELNPIFVSYEVTQEPFFTFFIR